MKTIKKTSLYILFFIAILFAGVAIGMLARKVTGDRVEISCMSDFKLYAESNKINLTLTYVLHKNNGLVTISGFSVNADGMRTSRISYRKAFHYVMHNDFFELQSINNNEQTDQTGVEILKKYLPAFYTNDLVKTHIVKIQKIQKGTWVVIGTNIPYFVCSKN